MHWCSVQVTIFVHITYFRVSGDFKKVIHFFISDDKKHVTFFVQHCFRLHWPWLLRQGLELNQHWVWSDGAVGNEGGHQCGRDHTIGICGEEIPAYRRYEIESHREREREAQILSLLAKCNSYNNEQPTFTKGYKVTLYSDSLRATALYAIYINGPNLGYQRG